MADAVEAFAAEVGGDGPVTVVGGRTQWTVGGLPDPSAVEARAPAGIVAFEPAEMTVRVRAGTTVGELHGVLAGHRQRTVLPVEAAPAATVGGVLAVGRSGVCRLGDGPLRDAVLEVRYVGADGAVVKAGGPTVKNVSGYDLCRLLVGSLGTLGFLAEVVLRTRPVPPISRWLAGEADPFELHRRLYRPSALLWDGTTTWVLLEGHDADVDEQAALTGLPDAEGPPPLPAGARLSLRPGDLRGLRGRFLAEVGVGVVHLPDGAGRDDVGAPAPPPVDPAVMALHRRIKANFDPAGRLNPGRRVLPEATKVGGGRVAP